MKSYSKSRGIVSIAAFVLVFAFFLYMVLAGFGYDHIGAWYKFGKGLDLEGGVSITYQVVGDIPSQQDMSDTIMKLQSRVEEFSTEAQVYQSGTNRIVVEIPGQDDPEAVLKDLKNPGTLIFCLDSTKPNDEDSFVMDGTAITNAVAGADSEKANSYVVQLTFTTEGQAKFAEATKKIAGTSKPLYIMFDNEVISNPTCKEAINSVSCVIEGLTSIETASMIASYIRIGALPIQLEEVTSSVVGATLGSNAIDTSMIAMLVGLAVICILMIIVFRMPGFASALALTFYTALVFAILSIFNKEITLTLPGIAGIILGIGMAVDANCIIFSRIKEEIGLGSTSQAAINAGFKKALSAIIDGNVTTLIAAIVLYIFGTGPVKGFAITLAISILVSMFSALVITKMLVKSFNALGMTGKVWYGEKKPVKSVNFVGKKTIWIVISSVVVLAGVAFMTINGVKKDSYPLNYSLDFVGGTSTTVDFGEYKDATALDEVKTALAEKIGTSDIVLTPSLDKTNTEVVIKTPVLTQENRNAMYDVLRETFNVDTQSVTYESISATVSNEMARSAIISVILAAIAMLIYIAIRFRDLRFASSSVICLIHDVLVVLAGYAIFRWTVGNTFIACMLTLVGYSINATIVVFDRIRENMAIMGKDADLKEVANLSVTQTLGRSVYTTLTTLVMVVALFIFGQTAIREFALPLMVGLVVGCYSSVCLAASVWYIFKTKIVSKKKKA